MESINKEAEIPINNGIYKQVEVPISNAMTYYKTNYRYTSMQNLDKYSSGSKLSFYEILQNLYYQIIFDHIYRKIRERLLD